MSSTEVAAPDPAEILCVRLSDGGGACWEECAQKCRSKAHAAEESDLGTVFWSKVRF